MNIKFEFPMGQPRVVGVDGGCLGGREKCGHGTQRIG